MSSFPAVDPAAIGTLADRLKAISKTTATIGQDTQSLRAAVMGSEQWNGTASQKWYTVVTGRVGDAELTNEVMGGAASLLDNLASDLDAQRRTYDRLSEDLHTARPVHGVLERLTGPDEVLNPDVQRAMDSCAARAAEMLSDAARKLLAYAALADDIRAQPAADRTPGVLAGADRHQASLELLATLFGSVTGGRLSGSKFEAAVLKALGIAKNNEVYRPDPAFEGKLTASGLAKGTIPDGKGPNFLMEIKGTKSLQFRYQLRLQVEQALGEETPLWVIKAAGPKADPSVLRAAESTGGGVLYTKDNGKSFADGEGNEIRVSYDKGTGKLEVRGYQPVTRVAPGGSAAAGQSSDPDAPQNPVPPGTADGSPAAQGSAVDTPDTPGTSGEPGDPEFPEFPELP